ncbi:MAG TPA: Xaa-Pro peptidase family protein [Actinokineospora sp.]|nr:Xaa-Pro peptidase family protein [Actinokineospora sp.]
MLANLDRLARRMDELGLDGIVATTAENVYYLTGVASVSHEIFPHSGQCFAVVTRDRLAHPRLISSRCDLDQIRDAQVALDGAAGFGTFYRELGDETELSALGGHGQLLHKLMNEQPNGVPALGVLARVLREAGLGDSRIAIDEESLPANAFDVLREELRGADLRPGADLFRWVRKVKTEPEVERLRAAAALTEQCILAAMAVAKPGATEIDLVREFERTAVSAGGRPKFTLIKFGERAAYGQSRPTADPLRRGEAVWFDVGLILDGYWSDLSRMFSIGQPTDKLARYCEGVIAGETAALTQTRPGMTGKELFDLTVDAVRQNGIPHYRRNHVGHGIGVEVYDRVLITPDNDEAIEVGTVVNFETPYYEFGFGAAMIEDPYVVRENGNELLTTLDRKLTVID